MTVNRLTKNAPDCEALTQLIPEYAFGLTDADETYMVESNLAQCPEASSLLTEYRALQNELRASVEIIEPPPELGIRLMAVVAEETAQLQRPMLSPSASTAPITPNAKPRRSYAVWLVAAAALIALVLTNLYWFSRVNTLSDRLDTLSASDHAFILTDTSALHWVRLAGVTDEVNASAFMMWNADSQTGLLYARGFPELPAGETYHLWLTRDGERVFAGVFKVDPDGDGALLFSSPEPINNFTRAGITAETQPDPNATSSTPNPPSQPIVTGEL